MAKHLRIINQQSADQRILHGNLPAGLPGVDYEVEVVAEVGLGVVAEIKAVDDVRVVARDDAIDEAAPSAVDDVMDLLILMAPALMSAILGPSAPTFFAPSTLSNNGVGQVGLFLAAFTWSLACAVLAFLIADERFAPEWYIGIVPAALLIVNPISFAFGGGSLEALVYGSQSGEWLTIVFILGGISVYGIGGLILGIFFGLTAGLDFQTRHARPRRSI